MIFPPVQPDDRKVRIFSLNPSFLARYEGKQPKWGPVGYFTFKRTYARANEDGSTEEFWQTCKRVVEGVYNIQKIHCRQLFLPWNEPKAQRSAQEMFRRMWAFKFLPPGRGLWTMGTDIVFEKGSACLNNCGFSSTEGIDIDFASPFCFLMDMSMLGVGIGGDTRGAGKIKIQLPRVTETPYVVEDSREGWVDLVRTILNSFVGKGYFPAVVDYSQVRPYGAAIHGFGGVASGPAPLKKCIENLTRLLLPEGVKATFEYKDSFGLLDRKDDIQQISFKGRGKGYKITSTHIVDIFNFVGKCVVAGGVRRCLPEGTLIHTSEGLVPIESVKVGSSVMTSEGYSEVTDWVEQGVQPITQITTQMGTFECTDRHRIAVITDVKGGYDWKRAFELEPGDRMVFVDQAIEGQATELPPFEYNKPPHSTTCLDIAVPSLTTETAWFLGMLAGDGYVRSVVEGGEVSIAVHGDQVDLKIRVEKCLRAFGVEVFFTPPREDDNSFKVRVKSRQLALYLSQFKRPNETLQVPECILRGLPDIRAAYIGGLSDADGSYRNRPMVVAASVYPSYLEEVQAVLASLAVPSRLRLHKDKSRERNGWKPLWQLVMVGDKAINLFTKRVARFISKFEDNRKTKRSQHDYGFPSQMALDGGISGHKDGSMVWSRESRQITVSRLESITGEPVKLVPVEVLDIEHEVGEERTYDISVRAGELVAQGGYLVHNTAEIMFGDPNDHEFMTLKQDQKALEDRRWASNNSIFGEIGMDYAEVARSIAINGEPGIAWLDNIRGYSRMGRAPDHKDERAMGCNPCVEQSLEDAELCCLVETFPAHHEDIEDYQRTLKMAYLYAKTVTLIPTHNPKTNQVMMRNRRIGCSMSGIIQAMVKLGRRKFLQWCGEGYSYIRDLDKIYSEWLCVPRSIKMTSVKPSGTTSLLCGATPGIHYPHAEHYIRNIRVDNTSPLVQAASNAGYPIEPDTYADDTSVISFPVKEQHFVKGKNEASIWEQFANAADMQRHWGDNQVSCTVTFNPEEARDIQSCLEVYETSLKAISLLPIKDHGYKQAPYIEITKEEYEQMVARIGPMHLNMQATHDATAEDKFCDGDTCNLP